MRAALGRLQARESGSRETGSGAPAVASERVYGRSQSNHSPCLLIRGGTITTSVISLGDILPQGVARGEDIVRLALPAGFGPQLPATRLVLGPARQAVDLRSVVFPVGIAPLGFAGQDALTPLGAAETRTTHSLGLWKRRWLG